VKVRVYPSSFVSVLRWANEAALRFSITSGLVPETVLAGAAWTWRDAEGGIFVSPAKAVPAAVMKQLTAAGVERVDVGLPHDAHEVTCWPELVSLARADVADNLGHALFVIEEGASLVAFAGELIRLGCDRLEWRRTERGYLLRAAQPPYYSLLRALEDRSGMRAYAPAPKGQDRVWVEIGSEHPLARFLRPAEGHFLLVSAAFELVRDGPWSDIHSLVDLAVPAKSTHRAAVAEPPRLEVRLRLARAATIDAPALWVIRRDAVRAIERLLASLPEDASRGLLFAVCGEEPIVVLRSRPGGTRGTGATLEIEGEPYRVHPSIPNLFLPCDATLEPPLRRDRVRELLAPDPDQVVWVTSELHVEHVDDTAFRPLSDWVEYVIDRSAAQLVPWMRSAVFEFDSFVGVDPGVPAAPRPERQVSTPKRASRRADPDPPPAPPTRAAEREARREAATLVAARVDPNQTAVELAAIESEFLSAGAAEQSILWGRMAPLNASLGRANDAALCWARALWELEGDGLRAAAAPWLAAEQGHVSAAAPSSLAAEQAPASARTLLAVERPLREQVRSVAVMVVAAPVPPDLVHDASLWLDRHDAALDIRTAWLARLALSNSVGGDRLGLARSRDRLLARVHQGLSLERDVPSFLRRAGASRDAAQIELLAAKLERLPVLLEKTRRKRSATEADPKLTGAYVHFILAYGFARIGRTERAAELRDGALAALPKTDAIHDLLSRAFVARIGQALEGLPTETPLPADISASLNALAKLDRYKVDRVRQSSKVLEPHERLDPIMAFQRGEADPRGPEFAALRGVSDGAIVDSGITAIMAQAKTSPPEDRARLYDGAMDFFPLLMHARAVELLDVVLSDVADIPVLRRVAVLEEAMMLAGHLGEATLARRIFDMLEPLVAGIGPDGAAEIAPLASGMLRTLRRFGLREESQRLLGALQAAARGKATSHLVARLHTAAALAYIGEERRARPVFEEALTVLRGELPMPERLVLTRALARALGAAPLSYAVAGLEQIQKRFDIITDSFNTNSHVCISVVDFMEALVLGYVTEDLAVDPIARRILDEDEYLVRRRIHRDLSR
jgi:hypothetical protein